VYWRAKDDTLAMAGPRELEGVLVWREGRADRAESSLARAPAMEDMVPGRRRVRGRTCSNLSPQARRMARPGREVWREARLVTALRQGERLEIHGWWEKVAREGQSTTSTGRGARRIMVDLLKKLFGSETIIQMVVV
jgi:hypothetical protein